VVFSGRRQFDFLWRETADHRQSGYAARPAVICAAGHHRGKPGLCRGAPRRQSMKTGDHLDAALRADLAQRQAQSLLRTRRILDGSQGPVIGIAGREYVSFCSNDYLGLAAHADVAAACKRGLDAYGTGSGAAHLITGHSRAHHALEEELAAFVGRPRALLFSTGYMANLGIAAA